MKYGRFPDLRLVVDLPFKLRKWSSRTTITVKNSWAYSCGDSSRLSRDSHL